MTTSTTPAPTAPLSKARRAGDLLFLSGQLPRGADGQIIAGDIAAQTRQALANIQAALTQHGATTGDVVKVTAWLTDRSHYDAFNAVYREVHERPAPRGAGRSTRLDKGGSRRAGSSRQALNRLSAGDRKLDADPASPLLLIVVEPIAGGTSHGPRGGRDATSTGRSGDRSGRFTGRGGEGGGLPACC